MGGDGLMAPVGLTLGAASLANGATLAAAPLILRPGGR
jgi:hypothetical protein